MSASVFQIIIVKGTKANIYSDIVAKLSNLKRKNQTVLDIGPGCSDLPLMLIEQCRSREHNLHMIDNPEMLDQLPNHQFITKIAGLYPNCTESLQALLGKVDVIICYSVLHYVLIDTAFFRFLDISLSLLAPGGQMLIGDIPNMSKRKRFLLVRKECDFIRSS